MSTVPSLIKTLCSRALVTFLFLLFLAVGPAFGQVDQGTITGEVTDASGGVLPNAAVTLTNTDTGFVLHASSNGAGSYTFSPIKIGRYSVSVTAPGFQTYTQQNLQVDVGSRLDVPVALRTGQVSENITVSTAPALLQTETSSTGQVISTKAINETPLNGRNWVYIAQLTAGVAPPFGNTRGSGSGDFVANGQRAEQNNFLLDGVDNNSNFVDFLNGASFLVRPPPDALAEFKVETGNFSAEFGHSAGAVMNASIKSGTNAIHGNVWEYFRNTALDATNWNAQTNPPYHQNQFGATLGFPIIRDKLFYFGDAEANRISIGQTNVLTVPTAAMRQGNFSELLNTNLTGQNPVTLYQPNSGGATPLACNGQANTFCANQLNPVALNILNLYPQPNANGGKTFSNLVENVSQHVNTWQWDQRIDWNISQKDQVFARYSYLHVITNNDFPLGPVLDGSGYGGGQNRNLAESFVLSETHVVSPTVTNEFRFGYNWGQATFLQANANTDIAPTLGLGGVPFAPLQGGLPTVQVSGVNQWGSPGTSNESQNVFQILDNVSKILGRHSIRMGVSFQSIRFANQYFSSPRGGYSFSGFYTSNRGASNTGFGVADFLANQMDSANIANAPNVSNAQWYYAGYVQDDWKVTPKLTLNLGLRYDYFEPYKENGGNQANFVPTPGTLGIGTGQAVYQIVNKRQNATISPIYSALLAQDNIQLQYVNDDRLVSAQTLNFGPRVGFAYQPTSRFTVHSGFGIFYGGLQSQGGGNLGINYPYSLSANVVRVANCDINACPSISETQGVTLENGLSNQLAQGLENFISTPGFHAIDAHVKTPYSMDYNFAIQQALTDNLVASVAYVGNASRHLGQYLDPNTSPVLLNPSESTQASQPFPQFGGVGTINYTGVSTYNSLQAKLEERLHNGLSFLATYTWAHALDDSSDAGGLETAIGDRNQKLVPVIDEFTNSAYDVRHRFTINGSYDLPVGRGRRFLNDSRAADLALGGWSVSYTFAMQTGSPFTVSPNNSGPSGGSARAIKIRDPFTGGGNPDPSLNYQTGQACPTSVRNKTNWYNPCAFADPLPGTNITTPVTDTATALTYLGGKSNQLYGPGYNRANLSLFKNFPTFREQFLQFRADAFNLFNHPSLGNPSTQNTGPSAGNITGPKFFQSDTPDARFFQLALKYQF